MSFLHWYAFGAALTFYILMWVAWTYTYYVGRRGIKHFIGYFVFSLLWPIYWPAIIWALYKKY